MLTEAAVFNDCFQNDRLLVLFEVSHTQTVILKGCLTWELMMYKGSPVLAMFSAHGVRAKLSVLKSGQDRPALQAFLSHCESGKCLDSRQTGFAN